MRERRERGEKISGMQRITPQVDFVESSWTSGTLEQMCRAKGTADHYWPWAVFFKILKFRQGSGPDGDDVL